MNIYSPHDIKEVEQKLNELFNVHQFANLEMSSVHGVYYLTKRPYISRLIKSKYQDVLNPMHLQFEMRESENGTRITIELQTKIWVALISIMIGGLMWITLISFWIAGKIDSVVPLILAVLVTGLFYLLSVRMISQEKKVIEQIKKTIEK